MSLKLCPSDLAAEGQISCSPQPTVSLKGCPSDLAADTLISCPSDVVETTVTNSSAAAARSFLYRCFCSKFVFVTNVFAL